MPNPNSLVFIGTYTHTTSDGIYVCRFDGDTGALEPVSSQMLNGGAENPSFLALHPNGRFLYAASEILEFDGQAQGALYAYAIDADSGRLEFINRIGSGGQGPCHVRVDATGKFLLAANYHGGSVCVAPIGGDGGLEPLSCFIQHEGASGVNPARQDSAHAHSINPDSQNTFVYVPDLGQDRIVIYRLDSENGTLAPPSTGNLPPYVESEPGAGPRHFAFHPNGRRAYAINELASTITTFDYDAADGTLTATQTIGTLPSDFAGANTTADIHVHPSGRFVYSSNRGHDSIAIFAVNADTGGLTALGHEPTRGATPRNFGIAPSCDFLLAANQDSDSVVSFRIAADSGALTPAGAVAKIPMPVCVRFS